MKAIATTSRSAMRYSIPQQRVNSKTIFDKTAPLRSRLGSPFGTATVRERFLRAEAIAVMLALVAAIVVPRIGGQQPPGFLAAPLPEKTGPLRPALLLLRQGKTAEARVLLEQQRKLRPDDAEVLYQIARSYLIDFYKEDDPDKRRTV